MNPRQRQIDRISPRQQQNWDWRAAANFILGGAGGSLLFLAALAASLGADTRLAMLLGMLLIGAGLACVWFEIGRPWRALNVYRHISSSWMTREAMFAPLAFAGGGFYFLGAGETAAWLAGLAGLGFLYSQARILAADKGIPAWRHPRCLPVVLASGLAEGAGLLGLLLFPNESVAWLVALALPALCGLRAVLWRAFLNALREGAAPAGSVTALAAIDARLQWLGNAAAAGLAIAAGMGGPAVLLPLAGVCSVAGGWLFKATLLRRAAFTQGMALPHLPVRGRSAGGQATAAVKPGW